MIKSKLYTVVAALLLSAAIAAPVSVRAAETATASATPKKAKAAKPTPPVTGKVASVDKTAKTFKVGEHTFTVTDATKWEGDLTLDTLKEGSKVTVSYTKAGKDYDATDVKAAAAKAK